MFELSTWYVKNPRDYRLIFWMLLLSYKMPVKHAYLDIFLITHSIIKVAQVFIHRIFHT